MLSKCSKGGYLVAIGFYNMVTLNAKQPEMARSCRAREMLCCVCQLWEALPLWLYSVSKYSATHITCSYTTSGAVYSHEDCLDHCVRLTFRGGAPFKIKLVLRALGTSPLHLC